MSQGYHGPPHGSDITPVLWCLNVIMAVMIEAQHAWHVDYPTLEEQIGASYMAQNSTRTNLHVNDCCSTMLNMTSQIHYSQISYNSRLWMIAHAELPSREPRAAVIQVPQNMLGSINVCTIDDSNLEVLYNGNCGDMATNWILDQASMVEPYLASAFAVDSGIMDYLDDLDA